MVVNLTSVHKLLLDNAKTGIVLLDSHLRFLYVNASAEALLEISDRKAHDLFIGDIFKNAEEDIGEMQTAITKNNSLTKLRAELNTVHAKKLIVDYTVNPFEENGETLALLELNSIEQSQKITRGVSLNSAYATTRELVRGLAHEIKNPLGGIRGAAQLLAQEISDNELIDYTQVIIQEADRLRNLVDRLVGSRKPLELKEINIHEVLERVRSLVAAETLGKGINLHCDYDPSLPPVIADSEKMIQAVLNLLRNSLQALNSPDVDHQLGEIILRTRISRNITIGSKFFKLAVAVDIIDNGPGIPQEISENIFYPMISGRPDGSGLGLPISHGIVTQHGGTIECECKPGETKFTVTIPIQRNSQFSISKVQQTNELK